MENPNYRSKKNLRSREEERYRSGPALGDPECQAKAQWMEIVRVYLPRWRKPERDDMSLEAWTSHSKPHLSATRPPKFYVMKRKSPHNLRSGIRRCPYIKTRFGRIVPLPVLISVCLLFTVSVVPHSLPFVLLVVVCNEALPQGLDRPLHPPQVRRVRRSNFRGGPHCRRVGPHTHRAHPQAHLPRPARAQGDSTLSAPC